MSYIIATIFGRYNDITVKNDGVIFKFKLITKNILPNNDCKYPYYHSNRGTNSYIMSITIINT